MTNMEQLIYQHAIHTLFLQILDFLILRVILKVNNFQYAASLYINLRKIRKLINIYSRTLV